MVETTLFKFDFTGFLEIGWFTAMTLIITFCIIDMFDTIGTLVGTASRANMLDEQGNMPNMKEALLSDAVGTVVGACTGTSTVTTFVESASGVEAGGRTGLTALVTGVLFLACIFIAPIAAIIPDAATSAALIYVGVLMLMGLKNIEWDDMDQVVPVAIMLIGMPVSSSIGHAIGLGLISYTFIKLFSGKGKEVSALTYIISTLFLIKFFLVVWSANVTKSAPKGALSDFCKIATSTRQLSGSILYKGLFDECRKIGDPLDNPSFTSYNIIP